MSSKKDWLERERTLLANERTFLSYVRTAFAAMVFGFALIQLTKSSPLNTIGLFSLLAGVTFAIAGLIHFNIHKKMININ